MDGKNEGKAYCSRRSQWKFCHERKNTSKNCPEDRKAMQWALSEHQNKKVLNPSVQNKGNCQF